MKRENILFMLAAAILYPALYGLFYRDINLEMYLVLSPFYIFVVEMCLANLIEKNKKD